MIDPDRAAAFLAAGRIAVVGASDDPKNFGRTIVQELAGHGIDVVAIHPRDTTVAGSPCYRHLDAVEGSVDCVIIMVSRDRAADVIRTCIGSNIPRVWLFKGFGPGAVSGDALRLCEDNHLEVIAGACPLMFLEPVPGVHKLHRALRRANKSLARSAA